MFWTRVLGLTLSVAAPSTAPTAPVSSASAPVSTAANAESPTVAASPNDAEASSDDVTSASDEAGTREACPSVTHVGLDIDGEQLGGGSDLLIERVRRRLQAVLRQWDVRPARDASHPVLTVRLSRLPDYAGYDLQFSARRGDEDLPEVAGSAECRICTEDEFVEHVGEGFERMLLRLVPTSSVATVTPATPPSPRRAVKPGPPPTVARPLPENPDLLRLRRAGVGLGIGGAVLIGAGVGIAILQPILLTDGVAEARQLWVPGTVMAVAGTTALVSGIVLLAVENRRRRARVTAAPGLARLEWTPRRP